MEHGWRQNLAAPKMMKLIINQLVWSIGYKHPVVVIIYGSGNLDSFTYYVPQSNSRWFLLYWFTLDF